MDLVASDLIYMTGGIKHFPIIGKCFQEEGSDTLHYIAMCELYDRGGKEKAVELGGKQLNS